MSYATCMGEKNRREKILFYMHTSILKIRKKNTLDLLLLLLSFASVAGRVLTAAI